MIARSIVVACAFMCSILRRASTARQGGLSIDASPAFS